MNKDLTEELFIVKFRIFSQKPKIQQYNRNGKASNQINTKQKNENVMCHSYISICKGTIAEVLKLWNT